MCVHLVWSLRARSDSTSREVYIFFLIIFLSWNQRRVWPLDFAVMYGKYIYKDRKRDKNVCMQERNGEL